MKTKQIHDYKAEPSLLSIVKKPRIMIREILAGLVTAFALIPEAISFAVIAGVDPKMGLYGSFILAISLAIIGGRPAMITGAAGATALVIAPLMKNYGLDYFVASIILAGVFQLILAGMGVAKLMRFIPRAVMVGFVNGLAILIFSAQLPELIHVPTAVYPLVALGIIIIILWPKLTKAVPAPLIAIIVLTGITMFWNVHVPTVKDRGELPTSLPEIFLPQVPLTFETFKIIAPYALGMALVGLMETLLTAKLVDDMTDTHSNKTRESLGQGFANVLSAFFGGMGGCAMIGQTMINVKISGGRTRLSSFACGASLLILVLSLGEIVGQIPMAALVAVMIMVCVGTFDWHSIHPNTLKKLPFTYNVVMVSTVVSVVVTNNLAVGVILGVVIAALIFVHNVAHLFEVEREIIDDGGDDVANYHVHGQLFFASSNDLTTFFSYSKDPARVRIDMSDTNIWDTSTVGALDAITTKYEKLGKTVEFVGMQEASHNIHSRITGATGME